MLASEVETKRGWDEVGAQKGLVECHRIRSIRTATRPARRGRVLIPASMCQPLAVVAIKLREATLDGLMAASLQATIPACQYRHLWGPRLELSRLTIQSAERACNSQFRTDPASHALERDVGRVLAITDAL